MVKQFSSPSTFEPAYPRRYLASIVWFASIVELVSDPWLPVFVFECVQFLLPRDAIYEDNSLEHEKPISSFFFGFGIPVLRFFFVRIFFLPGIQQVVPGSHKN